MEKWYIVGDIMVQPQVIPGQENHKGYGGVPTIVFHHDMTVSKLSTSGNSPTMSIPIDNHKFCGNWQ